MALQSSGAIALDDMHVEAGGNSGSTATINDADIRDMIDKSDGATMAFNEWYGASSGLPGDIMLIGQGVTDDTSGADVLYITVTSTGNTTDFGELIEGRHGNNGCGSSSTRALVFGGTPYQSDPFRASTEVVQYFTIITVGNGTDFGNLSSEIQSPEGVSYETRCLSAGGTNSSGDVTTIDYFTIASTGNASDHGDLTTTMFNGCGGINSTTRGIFVGGRRAGYNGGISNVIEYVTMTSTGNATDFGDVYQANVRDSSGHSSSTRGVINIGTYNNDTFSNVIHYVTIGSTGNSADFGDLTLGRYKSQASGNATRGVCAAGKGLLGGGVYAKTIDYITYASTGNSTDFGDMSKSTEETFATSNAHGGL